MYIFPTESKATVEGLFSSAFVAEIPSPLYPPVPFPATVKISPLAGGEGGGGEGGGGEGGGGERTIRRCTCTSNQT